MNISKPKADKYFGVVRKGELRLFSKDRFARYLDSFADGTRVVLTLKENKPTESDPMRKYYFGVVLHLVAKETGHSKEALHETFKRKYLSYTDRNLELTKSVFGAGSEMTIDEKWEYIMDVRRFAAEFLNVIIPEPE